MKRSGIVALVLLVMSARNLVAPAWSAAPPSAPPGLKMEAKAAFAGYFKHGEWLPVWVGLENSGPDLEAEARVRVTGSWGATTYAAPALLPTGSRKRIPVYVLPNNFSHMLEVELVTDEGLLLAQQVPVDPQANINYLVGVIAPKRGALSFITGASLPGQGRPISLIDLPLGDLPERPEALHSFDCLILNDTDTSSLTPAQKTALKTWVRQGGRLVVGGGAGGSRTATGLPEALLPLMPGGVAEIEALPALADFAEGQAIRVPGPFVVTTGQDGQGRTLVAQDGLPLVREQAIGSGFVDSVALDLAVSPFDAWVGTTAFWEQLLSPGAAYPEWLPPDVSDRQLKAGQMAYALSRLPALDLPSIRGLSLLLITYVLLVGPINYLVLGWRKRLHWAWVSVPLMTVAFSAGAFGMGYALRGSDLILNKIAVIELQQEGTASVASYLGLFSPTRQSYEIEVQGRGLLSPLNPEYDPWGGGGANTGSEMIFVQGEPGFVRGLTVNQWSMQAFMTERVLPDFGRIESELQVNREALTGAVRNETAYAVSDALLVWGDHFARLGDLRPGQEVAVTMDLPDLPDLGFGQPLSIRLVEEELKQSGSGDPPPEAELKRMIIESVFEQGGRFGSTAPGFGLGGTAGSHRGLALLGWLNEAPPEVRVAGRTPTHQTTALLYAPVPVHLSDRGDISLPPGLLPGRLVEMPEEGTTCGPGTAALWLERGHAIFEFQLPDEIQGIQAERLSLLIGAEGGGWWQPPDLAVYDWDAETWINIDEAVVGVNAVTDAAGTISETGLIHVRLASEANRGGCLYVELGMEGTQ
jgi:hypothetical protein